MTADLAADPAALSDADREAVEAELFALADDEFVLAERYTEWQVRGPTLEADISIANVSQDELGHARLWYDLLEGFGYDETELLWERDPADFRHATLVELPFERGDWADLVVRSYLYDTAEHLRLEALSNSSYPPIADRVGTVLGEESFHRDHATTWLERLCDPDGAADSDAPRPSSAGSVTSARDRVQAALDRLFPHALTLFEPTEQEATILDRGVRSQSCADLREAWRTTVTPFLTELGLEVPDEPADGLRPEPRGRDGSHTDHWRSLYDEFTYTYELLDRDEAPSLMPRPGAGDGDD